MLAACTTCPIRCRSRRAGRSTRACASRARRASPTARCSWPRSRTGASELAGVLDERRHRVMIDGAARARLSRSSARRAWRVAGTRRPAARARSAPLVARATRARRRASSPPPRAWRDGPVTIDGSARMRERPIDDLARALAQLGARVEILGARGCPPVRVAGGGLRGGDGRDRRAPLEPVRVGGAARGALRAARRGAALRGRRARVAALRRSHARRDARVRRRARSGTATTRCACARARATRRARYAVEADASSAAYPFCAAAIAGGRVRVEGLDPRTRQPTSASSTCSSRWAAASRADADWAEVRAPASGLARRRRRHERDARRGARARGGRAVRGRARRGSATSPTCASRRPTGWPRSRPSCASSARARAPTPTRSRSSPAPLRGGRDRDLRRPPHGDGVRAGGPAPARRGDPRPGLRREDLARLLRRCSRGSERGAASVVPAAARERRVRGAAALAARAARARARRASAALANAARTALAPGAYWASRRGTAAGLRALNAAAGRDWYRVPRRGRARRRAPPTRASPATRS